MKDQLLHALLYTHIAGGGLALLTGMGTLSTPKGGSIHRPMGRIFFYCMLAVSVSAFIISVLKELDFLLAIAVFSFYMNYTGYRALKNKTAKFRWFDWLPVIVSVAAIAYMFYARNIVLLVFGGILTLMIIQDVRLQLKSDEEIKEARRLRVLTHIARMVGTYIATVTAFLVVNINFVKPGWLLWLLPTFLGVPFIYYWSGIWKKKLGVKPA